MKKIFTLLVALMLFLGLTACGGGNSGDKPSTPVGGDDTPTANVGDDDTPVTPTKTVTFEEYLAKASSFSAKDLDALVDLSTPAELPDVLGMINVPTTKLTFTQNLYENADSEESSDTTEELPNTGYVYFWQDSSVIYMADSFNNQNTASFKLDLSEIEAMLGGAVATVPTEDMTVSGLINEGIAALLTKANLPITLTVEDILAAVNFTVDDFEAKGDGVYQLKNSTIAKFVVALSKEKVTEEQVNAILAYFDKLEILVTYANNHISNVSVALESTSNGQTYTAKTSVNLSLDFTFVKDIFMGLAVNLNYTLDDTEDGKNEYEGQLTVNTQGISADLVYTSTDIDATEDADTDEIHFALSSKGLNLSFVNDGKEFVKVDATFSATGATLKAYVSLYETDGEGTTIGVTNYHVEATVGYSETGLVVNATFKMGFIATDATEEVTTVCVSVNATISDKVLTMKAKLGEGDEAVEIVSVNVAFDKQGNVSGTVTISGLVVGSETIESIIMTIETSNVELPAEVAADSVKENAQDVISMIIPAE